MKLAIETRRLVTPLQELRDAVILIDGESIETVGLQTNVTVPERYQVSPADRR